MPRTNFLLCSGVCLLNTTYIAAQTLPRNPTAKQVVGFHLQEQQKWNVKQLPRNSVLYKSDYRYAAWQASMIPYKKQRPPAFSLPSFTAVNLKPPEIMNPGQPASVTSLQSVLLRHRMQQSQWNKRNWWKDPLKAPGSGLLRGIVIQSNNHSPL